MTMQHKIFTRIIFLLLGLVICFVSCEEIDLCEGIQCENGGECFEGFCDCPIGFLGEKCEILDISNIQIILDAGISPKEILDAGIPTDSLYGKIYREGYIFYVDTLDGSGMIAHTENLWGPWGCQGTDLESVSNVQEGYYIDLVIEGARVGDGKINTDGLVEECLDEGIAAKLCRALGEDWFLPSIDELRLMHDNLYLNGYGNFEGHSYWSSSEYGPDGSWFKHFMNDYHDGDYKNDDAFVRAAKEF